MLLNVNLFYAVVYQRERNVCILYEKSNTCSSPTIFQMIVEWYEKEKPILTPNLLSAVWNIYVWYSELIFRYQSIFFYKFKKKQLPVLSFSLSSSRKTRLCDII